MSIIITKEWYSASEKSYCNQPDLLKYENAFRAFEFIWGMSTIDFMLFVSENYNADITLYKHEDGSIKFYTISFKDYGKCHRFTLDTNNQAKYSKATITEFLSKWGQ